MSQITITVRKDGPYRVELAEGASLTMVDHEGNAIALPGPKFSLCRCGASSRKPFCDGTHSKIGFKGAEEAARQFDAQGGAAPGGGSGDGGSNAGGSAGGGPAT